jgi:DNA-binding LacI/PurR family transcriptional regulator
MPRPDHVYQKLLTELRKQVHESFAPGDALPSQRALAYMYGVGQATVHRALRELSKAGVLEVKPRLGWIRASKDPRAPATRTVQRLGLLTRRGAAELSTTNYALYRDIRAAAAQRNIELVVHANPRTHHPTPGRNRLELSRVPWTRMDVALLVEVEDAATLADPLLKQHRVLAVDLDATQFGLPSVTFDDYGAGRTAARHFWEMGHRRFALVDEVNEPGWPSELTWMARRHGFESEIGRLGGVIHPAFRIPGFRSGRRASLAEEVRRCMAAWWNFPAAERPTALFAIDEAVLPFVHAELAAAGLQVPRDLSVIVANWDPVVDTERSLRYTSLHLDLATLVRRAFDIAAQLAAAPLEARLYTAPVLLMPGNTVTPPQAPR